MSGPRFLGPGIEDRLDWAGVAAAIRDGHVRPRAEITDSFLYRGGDTLLNRAAWIDGMGMLVKTATVFPGNADLDRPTIGGAACLFSDRDGGLEAVIDFALLTKWKTAGDSLAAALRLARPDAAEIVILGAGTVARSLVAAYRSHWPDARIRLWNRSPDRAGRLAAETGAEAVADLAAAVAGAGIVACATMSPTPVLRGEWLSPGTHVDLVGAYRPDMREADDDALRRARIFVDSRATTLEHIGELKDPLARGVIAPGDVIADFYDAGTFARSSDDEITLFKNGGGAHLDLMVAHWMAARA